LVQVGHADAWAWLEALGGERIIRELHAMPNAVRRWPSAAQDTGDVRSMPAWEHPRMAADAFALILTMLGIGMLFARLRVLPDAAAEVLNRIVLYVCLPAAVLTYVPRLQMDVSVFGIVATPWLLAVATVGLVGLASRWLGFRRDAH